MTPAGAALVAATHAGATTAQDVSIGHVLLQMVVALGIVIGGIWGFGKIMGRSARGRRTGARGRGRGPGDGLQVLSRQAIGKGKSIAVVQAGDQCFLVGIADSGLTPLGELRPSPGGAEAPATAGSIAAAARRAVEPTGATGRGVELAPVDLGGVDLSALALAGAPPGSGRSRTEPGAAGSALRSWLDTLREATVRR